MFHRALAPTIPVEKRSGESFESETAGKVIIWVVRGIRRVRERPTVAVIRERSEVSDNRGVPVEGRAIRDVGARLPVRDGLTDVPERTNESYARDPITLGRSARKSRKGLLIFLLIASDCVFATIFWAMSYVIYGTLVAAQFPPIAPVVVVFNVAAWIVFRALVGLYPGYGLSEPEELRRQTYATLVNLIVTVFFAFSMGVEAPRLPILLFGINVLHRLLLAPLMRYLAKNALRRVGLWGEPVLICGAGQTGQRLVRTLTDEWGLGYRPVAIFDNRLGPVSGRIEGVPYGGSVGDAVPVGKKYGINTLIFATPHTRREHLSKFVELMRRNFRHVVVVPNLGGITNSAAVARDFSGIFGVEIRHNLLDPWAQRSKRALDLAATLVGGVFVLPIILLLCLLVWLESRGPIFYADKRLGKDAKLFACLKFKTMVPDAEALLQRMLDTDEDMRKEYLTYHKLRNDPRVTRVGRFLRKTSLDELPQLWNVLRGEMSLVGPRPYLPRESVEIGSTQDEIRRVTPGMTGPWQVSGRNDTSFQERVDMDAIYVHNWSVWMDIVLVARTIKILIFRAGAY
jgi:Undecaprenyl-phosphate galactose phosphotransferase WbaP